MKVVFMAFLTACSLHAFGDALPPQINCKLVSIKLCPNDDFSYACAGRYGYKVSCEVTSETVLSKIDGEKMLQAYRNHLETRWGY